MRNVLFPINDSEQSDKTLTNTFKNLDKEKDRIYLLHVIQVTENTPATNMRLNNADKIRSKAMLKCESEGFKVSTSKNAVGNIVEEICLFADKNDIELIIIGSQRKHGISNFFRKNISENILKKEKQNVLIIKTTSQKAVLNNAL